MFAAGSAAAALSTSIASKVPQNAARNATRDKEKSRRMDGFFGRNRVYFNGREPVGIPSGLFPVITLL